MSVLDILGLLVGGMMGGASLLMLFLGWLADTAGDNQAPGCMSMGLALLVLALAILIWTVVA